MAVGDGGGSVGDDNDKVKSIATVTIPMTTMMTQMMQERSTTAHQRKRKTGSKGIIALLFPKHSTA